MKVCPKCGTPQKDENTCCIECGAVLRGELSAEEKAQLALRQQEEHKKRVLYGGFLESDPEDPFSMNLKQRIIAILNLLTVIASLVVMVGAELLPVRGPALCLVSLAYCGVAAFDLFFPEVRWSLHRLRGELRGYLCSDDPSDVYLFWHWVTPIITLVIGWLCFAAAFIVY